MEFYFKLFSWNFNLVNGFEKVFMPDFVNVFSIELPTEIFKKFPEICATIFHSALKAFV